MNSLENPTPKKETPPPLPKPEEVLNRMDELFEGKFFPGMEVAIPGEKSPGGLGKDTVEGGWEVKSIDKDTDMVVVRNKEGRLKQFSEEELTQATERYKEALDLGELIS